MVPNVKHKCVQRCQIVPGTRSCQVPDRARPWFFDLSRLCDDSLNRRSTIIKHFVAGTWTSINALDTPPCNPYRFCQKTYRSTKYNQCSPSFYFHQQYSLQCTARHHDVRLLRRYPPQTAVPDNLRLRTFHVALDCSSCTLQFECLLLVGIIIIKKNLVFKVALRR